MSGDENETSTPAGGLDVDGRGSTTTPVPVPAGEGPERGEVDLTAVRERIEQAHQWVVDLCNGKRWQMRISVDHMDSDIVISDALIYAERLADEVESLRALVAASLPGVSDTGETK